MRKLPANRTKAKPRSEHEEQAALVRHVSFLVGLYPELALLFAIPNGGARDVVTGARLKAEGVRPGVPDLLLPVGRDGFFGLFIEMKTAVGSVRPNQKVWHDRLLDEGYSVKVCRSAGDAVDTLVAYLEKDPTPRIIGRGQG